MIEIALAVFVGLLILLYFALKEKKNYPPGPPIIPIIGSLPFLSHDMKKDLGRLRKKYGPVFGFSTGLDFWICICDFNLFKEALNREEFQDRPAGSVFNDFSFRDEHNSVRGIIMSNGKEWQEQRRFALRTLRDFGFGKIGMEHLIQDEIEKCVNMIKKDIQTSKGEPISLSLRLNVAILNALWHISTGEKLEYDDPQIQNVVNKINSLMTASRVGGILFAFPWLKYIIPGFTGYTKMKNTFDDIITIIKQSYDHHMATFQKDHSRDFIDSFINQIEDAKEDPSSSFHGQKGLQNLIVGMIDLFIGGSETTSNTLAWALFYLSKFPETQEKASVELETVIGYNRLPSLDDRPQTPYLEAIVLETHRITSVVFSGIPRTVTKDTTLGGFMFPKGAGILPGLYEMMHDEDHWGDPFIFRPERFLDESLKKVANTERLVPFGSGKRMCIGSTLAQNELYLFVATFLQKFKFSDPSPGHLEPLAGLVLGCPDYTLMIQERMGS